MAWNRRRTLLAVAALAALVLFWRLLRPAVLEVETETVVRGPLTVSVEEEGRTEVRDRFVIAAPVTGRVGRLTLEAGDSVRRDATVACVAPQPLDPRSRDQAQARLDERVDHDSRAATGRCDRHLEIVDGFDARMPDLGEQLLRELGLEREDEAGRGLPGRIRDDVKLNRDCVDGHVREGIGRRLVSAI